MVIARTNTSTDPVLMTDLNQLPPPSDRTMFSLSTSKEAQVPTTKNPIRFAVLYRDWHTSNAWGIRVEETGDGYIYCRDNMKGQKVSLHASGKQHISIDPNSASAVNLTRKHFLNQWHEPNEGIATFRLIFPPWGIRLNDQQYEKFRSTWAKNDIFIEGHHEFLTMVSFFIVREETTLQKRGNFPGFLLGELSLRVGRKLAITAEWELERGLKSTIEDALRRTASFVDTIKHHPGRTLAACVTGECGSSNSIYMVSFPLLYSDPSPQEPAPNAP